MDYIQTIPHNREAEEALLGSFLINPELLRCVPVHPDDFYIQRHKFIYEAMQDVKALDLVTLSSELESRGYLGEVGGSAYLTGLLTASADSYNAEHYADIVREKASRRRDLQIANLIAKGSYNGGIDRASIIDQLTRNAPVNGAASPLRDSLGGFVEMVEERAKDPRDMWGVSTGLPDVDRLTGGLHPQQTTMIVGSPGVGKTTMMLQWALHAAVEGHSVAVYELEMDLKPRLLSRLIMMLTGVPYRAMMSGRMEDHWKDFYSAIEKLDLMNKLFVSDNPVMSSMDVRADVARLKANYQIDYVALDYLNLLTDSDGDSKNDNTTNKAVRFRQTCREFDVVGLTVQSVNKEGMKSVIPSLADMSGPAEVAFTADTVFFLVKDPDKPMMYKLLPAKQRDGDMGSGAIDLIQPKGKLGFSCLEKVRAR